MIYKNLYIIGNGFDQHHDIPCGFPFFKSWVKEHDVNLFFRLTQVYDNAWDSEWWSDFENSLAQLNICVYANSKGDLYDPEYLNGGSIDEKTEYASKKILEEFSTLRNSLKEAFQKWLVEAYKACNKDKKIRIHTDGSVFLSFNYTKTLEDEYGIDSKQIYHIHGIIDDKDSMIIGHGLENEDLRDILESQKPKLGEVWNKGLKMMTRLQYVEPGHKRLATYSTLDSLLAFKKDVKGCIENNIRFFEDVLDVKKIFVYGFSFSPIDMPYLEKIVRRTSPETHWVISVYSQEDRIRVMCFVMKYNIQNVTIINGIKNISIQ